MYLLNSPNDVRTWSYPTYNIVSDTPSEDCLTLVEDDHGEIFIKTIKGRDSIIRVRVSSEKFKSIYSLGVKRYKVI